MKHAPSWNKLVEHFHGDFDVTEKATVMCFLCDVFFCVCLCVCVCVCVFVCVCVCGVFVFV